MNRGLWLVPALLAIAAHISGIWSGFTNWDDQNYLVQNVMTEQPLGLGWLELLLTKNLLYPIPVTVLAYAAQRAIFGLDPAMFHLVSILTHAGVVTLIAVLARRLGASKPGAIIAASLFAVHPLVVEPIAWATGQKDLWCALFLLILLVVRARPGRPTRLRTAAVVALSLVAMLSKPTAVCAPVLVAAVDWALERRLRDHLWTYALLFGCSLAAIALSILGHESHGVGPSNLFGFESLAHTAWAVKLQLTHAVVPYGLGAMYYEPSGFELAIGVAAGLLAIAAVIAIFGHAVKRGKRALAGGVLAAAAAYAPTSGLIPLARGAADSYMYLPLVFAAAFGAIAIGRWFERSRRNTLVAAVLIGAMFAGLSVAQHRHWRDATALWYRVADLNPSEPHALYVLATGFIHVRDLEAAHDILVLIEREHPDFVEARGSHAEVLIAWGREAEADVKLGQACENGALWALARYGFFLINTELEPADPDAARTALLVMTPMLAARGKNPNTLERGIERLRGYGYEAAAWLLQQRLDHISSR